MIDLASYFSTDYWEARDRFRTAAEKLAWRWEAIPIAATCPRGSELTIDVATSPGDSTQTLLLSSGVHGVEGFLGSAAQLQLLTHLAQQPRDDHAPRIVCVHGVNPYGFAQLRRFDENNVDLNRNFLQPSQPFAGAPELYGALDPLLNPKSPPSGWDPFLLKAALTVVRYQMPKLRQALAGGQYEYPQGLFFGGKEPTASHRVLEQELPRWLEGSDRVMHLDYHTGLGRSGDCRLLIDYVLPPEHRQWLSTWFGADSFETCDDTDIAYETSGGFGEWCVARKLAPDYLYACAEYGTYGPIRVLAALRAENRAHHWGKPDQPATITAKERLLERFCPASLKWRRSVMEHSAQMIDQALTGLSGS